MGLPLLVDHSVWMPRVDLPQVESSSNRLERQSVAMLRRVLLRLQMALEVPPSRRRLGVMHQRPALKMES